DDSRFHPVHCEQPLSPILSLNRCIAQHIIHDHPTSLVLYLYLHIYEFSRCDDHHKHPSSPLAPRIPTFGKHDEDLHTNRPPEKGQQGYGAALETLSVDIYSG